MFPCELLNPVTRAITPGYWTAGCRARLCFGIMCQLAEPPHFAQLGSPRISVFMLLFLALETVF